MNPARSLSLLLAARALRKRPLRSLLTTSGIVLGVGMIVAVLSLSSTLFAGFRGLFDTVYGKTDLIVSRDVGGGVQSPFDERLLAKVRAVPGVDAAGTTGEASGVANVVGRDGVAGQDARDLVYVGGFEEGKVEAVADFVTVAGRDPGNGSELMVQDTFARDRGLAVGDRVRLAVPAGTASYRISGIFRFTRAVEYGGASFAGVTLQEAQRAFQLPGRLSQINVRVVDRSQVGKVQARIQRALGSDLAVRTRSESVDELSKQLSGIRTFLLFFAAVALFVGAYLIYNAFNVTVLQRTREIGMLRTLGVTKRGVLRQVLAEATALGIAGSAIGLGAGAALAFGLVKLMGALFVGIPSGTLSVPVSALVMGVVAGTVVTALAAAWPAFRASRTSPLEAMRRRAEPVGRIPWRSAIAGVVVLAASAPGIYLLTRTDRSRFESAYGVAGVVGIFLGLTLAAPLVVRPLVELLGRPLQLAGRAQGRIAVDNAERSPGRTGLTASSVMVGLALVVVFGAFSASAVSAVRSAVDRTLRSDYIVGPKSFGMGFQGFAPALERQIARLPATEAASGVAVGFARVDGKTATVLGYEPRTIGELSADELVGGGSPPWSALEREALVTEGYAVANHVEEGDTIRVSTPAGPDVLRVAGVIRTPDQHVILSRTRAARDAGATQVFWVYVKTADNAQARAELRRQLERVIVPYPATRVLSNAELKDQITAQFDQIFGLIYALLGAAIVASALGIANTMAMSVLERTRELGLIRALGGTRRQVRAMIRRESILVTFVGVVLGLAAGLVLGYAFVRASETQFPGLDFVVPWTIVGAVLVISLVLAVVAAALPARRAARLRVIEAVGYE